MKTAITQDEIKLLIFRQLSFFGIDRNEQNAINYSLGGVFARLEYCFERTPNKYYSKNGETYFNPFHSGQYCIFLYMLSNEVWKNGNSLLADKIYYLNKMLNGCDMFYEVELPEVFMLDHPVGSVIGRAKFSDGFSFCQNCTVGNNKGVYPQIGQHVKLCANSSIIGNCHIGDNVTIGADACVKDQDVPANSIVFGQSPNLIIKTKN